MNASDHVFMSNQYADSDAGVNSTSASESESCCISRATFDVVAAKKTEKVAEPVSEFLRFLIDRWEADGRLLKDLAAEAELAKSMPSQIKARTSDASFYSASRLAVPLGYADLPALVTAAYAWWRSADRTQMPPTSEDEAHPIVAEAIRDALKYAVTQEQIDRVLQRLPPERYAEMPGSWWLSRFLEEQSLDRDLEGLRRGRDRSPLAAGRHDSERRSREAKARASANADAKASKPPRSKTKSS